MAAFDQSYVHFDMRGSALRSFKSGHLHPYGEALAAYALWADLRPYHHRVPAATVIRRDKSWYWCGGFAAIEHGARYGLVESCVLKFKPDPDQITAAIWFEALQAPYLPTNQIYRWRSTVARHLPHNLLRAFFGLRGMSPSSCARILGLTRQTVSLHWDGTYD